MALSEILLVKLGTRLAKFLFKTYLGRPGEVFGDDLTDIGKGQIESLFARRDASRVFEGLGERIAAQLLPLFEDANGHGGIVVAAVTAEVEATLDGKISPEVLVGKDLDPTKLLAELRVARPLPRGQFSAAEEEFYDRVLAEAVRYLVEVAAQLPRFEKAAVAESLKRLSHLGDIVEQTARRVEHIEAWVATQERDPGNQKYESDYRLAVIRNLDFLELFGVDIQPDSSKQALTVAYISLQLETGPQDTEEGEGESAPVESVLDSLAPGASRLVLRGEAGSGKSTLFRWIAIQAAKGKNRRSSLSETAEHSWRSCVPFLIRLRDCQAGKLPKPDAFPELIAKEIGSPPAEWVLSVLRAGRALLLFDGVDEVPNAHRTTVGKEISAIVRAYPGNYLLVSTRPLGVPSGWLASEGFRDARVNPLSDLDRARFIEKWHEAVAEELRRIGKKAEDFGQLAEELKLQLPANPPIARLATNPLLCAMICALHRDRHRKLPESPAELCEALCHMLLHRRERESGLDLSQFPESYRRLSYEQKRAIVRELAYYMVENEESSVTIERARVKVSEVLRQFPGHAEEAANEVLDSLVERSGMLREARPGSLDFIHNTFKEFLGAERFAEAGDAGRLAKQALDATWQRVILFAVTTKKQGFASEVVRRLLQVANSGPEGTPDSRHRFLKLLILRCHAVALFLEPDLEQKVERLARELFPPSSMEDAEALASGGEAMMPYLQFREALSESQAAACVRALRLIGTLQARTTLEGYSSEKRLPVLSELAQAVNPLALVAVQQMLLRGEHLPDGIRSQISDLSPLSWFPELRELRLSSSQVSDLAPLAELSSLLTLDLSSTQVTDLAPLAGLSSLQWLGLSEIQVSDLAPLARLSSLLTLDLSSTQVTDLAPLAGLSSLQWLSLSEAQVSDLAPLARLHSLKTLFLNGTQVSNLAPLAGLSSLQMLYLDETQVSDLTPLARLHSMKQIDISVIPSLRPRASR